MLMQIDGTFLFVAISFIIFLFIIKTILFNPITKVIEERENFYAKNSKMRLESKEKSKNLLDEKETALKKAKTEASEIVKKASFEANNQSALKIKQVKQEVQTCAQNNAQVLLEENKTAKLELKAQVNSIVRAIVDKVLPEELDINLDEAKIEQYLKI